MLLTIGCVGKAGLNMGLQRSLGDLDFESSVCSLPRVRSAGSHSNSMFDFLRILHTALMPPHPRQHLSSGVLLLAILTDVRWCLIVHVICMFPVITDTEHLCVCFLTISMSSLKNVQLQACEECAEGCGAGWGRTKVTPRHRPAGTCF